MADEITVIARLECINGEMSVRQDVSGERFDQATQGYTAAVQTVGTAAAGELLEFHTDISSRGWALFRNLDATNYVEVGVQVAGTFYPLLRLRAGEPAVLPLSPAVAVYAKANTANVKLQYTVLSS